MVERYGVMLIETDEVIMHIYERDVIGRLVVLSSQRYPFSNADMEILSVIVEFLHMGSAWRIAEWKLCSRLRSADTVQKVFDVTGIRVELIQPKREQELLLLGMAMELV